MDAIKRYWNALGAEPKEAIKKVIRFQTVLFVISLIVSGFLLYAALSSIEGEDVLGAFRVLGVMGLVLVVALCFGVYGFVLVFRAHRAMKEWLFGLKAPGYPTRDTWTSGDGWLLGFALIAFTSLPVELASLVLNMAMQEWTSLPGTILWIVLAIVLPPIAARRFIPLGK